MEVKLDKEWMLCIIEDNGIGREKAMEIKKRSRKSYKSRAMQIIDERVQILNQSKESNISIEVSDVLDEQGEVGGTKAVVKIPFEE